MSPVEKVPHLTAGKALWRSVGSSGVAAFLRRSVGSGERKVVLSAIVLRIKAERFLLHNFLLQYHICCWRDLKSVYKQIRK